MGDKFLLLMLCLMAIATVFTLIGRIALELGLS